MQKFKALPILAGAAVLGLALGSTVVSAAPTTTTYTIGLDNIGVNCSAGCGTVTVTDAGLSASNTYQFDIDLSSSLLLHNVGGPNSDVFGANLAGVTSIASGPVNNLHQPTSNFDGFGSFAFGVSCTANQPVTGNSNICDPNGQSPLHDLIFSVFAPTGESLTGNILGLAVAEAGNASNTGFATVPAPPIGHSPLVLLAIGGLLFGGKLFAGSKKHRGTAIPYAAA